LAGGATALRSEKERGWLTGVVAVAVVVGHGLWLHQY
jgi:hypothetical protein